MNRNIRMLLFIVFALLWAVAIAGVAIRGWPHVPLDVSAADAATKAAFAKAISMHVARHIALAVVPPLVMLVVAWRWIRG